jgi:hypothetical protein
MWRAAATARGRAVSDERIAIVDLADELQVRKQRVFKILKRLGIRPTQRREASRGNQNVAMMTLAEAAAVRSELGRGSSPRDDGAPLAVSATIAATEVYFADDVGVFYLIHLEPDHDPGRFKVGFTTELDGRLRKHRCSAPFAQSLKSWASRRTWERAAIDCVTQGCEKLHTEVFRTASLSEVSARADAFFAIMPKLAFAIADEVEDEPQDEDAGADEPR